MLRHLESMLLYRKKIFHILFHLILLKEGIVAFTFQVQTDPNQAIKQACLRKKLY